LNFSDQTTHERAVKCTLDEKTAGEILAKHVAQQAGFDLTAAGVDVAVHLTTSGGGPSVQRRVQINLTQDLRAYGTRSPLLP